MGIAGSRPEGVRTGWVVLWRSVAVVFTAEFVVMLALRALGLPFDVSTALADSLLLSAVALPLLYAVVLRPATALAARQAGALAEARFETVAEAIQDAVLIFDLERTIRFANRAAERTFGCAEGTLLGAEMERLMPEEVAAGFRKDMARYATGGDTPVIGQGRVEREASGRVASASPPRSR
jgi:PAS domain S-box-containing protein